MDLVEIFASAGLSALLFICLEFTVILPLFRKIVTTSVNDMVTNNLIPKITEYINAQIDGLTERLTKSLFNKFRGVLGGTSKGTNAILRRLAQGEDPEDVLNEEQYEPSTIEKVLDIAHSLSNFLPNPSTKTAASPQDPAEISGIKEN